MNTKRAPRVWAYKPDPGWHGLWTLLPIRRGNDEWHRFTLVFGLPMTGQVVVALWHFRDDCPMCDCGMMQWPHHQIGNDDPEWYCPECDENAGLKEAENARA